MENILSSVNLLTLFLAALGATVSAIFVVYSGYLFISAQGDPPRMAQAQKALIGVPVGLAIIGGAFIIPATVSRYVIEPAGGVRVDPRAGVDCDGLLKDQLVVQRNVNSVPRMQFLISQIQGKRDECAPEFWSPVVRDGDEGWPPGCIDAGEVGGIPVPKGSLRPGGNVVTESRRDSDNNIMVYWTHPNDPELAGGLRGLPSDGSVCWLYVASFSAWTEGYFTP